MLPAITTWLFNRQLAAGEIGLDEVLDFFARDLEAVAVEIPRVTYGDWSPAGRLECV